MAEGVRDTYGADYFTAGPQFTADVHLNAPLTIELGSPFGNGTDSSLMFSGKIISNPAFNTITYNGISQGTGLWITSNNSFANGMFININDFGGGAGGSSTGYTMHLADAGRVDQAYISLSSNRCSLGLQDNSTVLNPYNNHVDVFNGNVFADRSYQSGDIQDSKINVIQYLTNGLTVYDTAVFGSWPLYGTFGRTNNGYGTRISSLDWTTTDPLNHKVTIRVQNGNLTENRGGSRYVSGANRLQEAHNYTYVDMVNEIAAVTTLEKDGPGVLAISQVQGVGGAIGIWNTTNLLAMEGVLRLGTPTTPQAAPLGVNVRPDAAVGIGWNTTIDPSGRWGPPNTPFPIIPGGVGIVGQVGAVDIDMWGHGVGGQTIDTNFVAMQTYLRVGSSMGADASFDPQPLATKHAQTSATIIPCTVNGPRTYYFGGGGGTLEVDSLLNDYLNQPTAVEMGTTGTLLPGRIAFRNQNTYTGNTNIYAGTLQLMTLNAVRHTAAVNLSTYDQNLTNGLYANPLAGYAWTEPGQLLLDPGKNGTAQDWDLTWYTAQNGGPLLGATSLSGGVIGWTGDVIVPAPPGIWGTTITSNLNPLAAANVNVLGLGGEYSAGTMTVPFPIANAPNYPVLLYKAGKNSKLDLSTGGGSTYTGGTIIAGGEIKVINANQLNASVLNVNGGPIDILNGGRLHIAAGGTDTVFCVPIMVNTAGTPDPVKNCGSVIEVDPGVTATLTKNFNFSPAPYGYLEKDGSGVLAYVAPAPAGGPMNAWGLKLTAGLVQVNQMPVNAGVDSGPVIFNNGNLQVSQVPVGMAALDTDPAYGFRNIVSLQGTESTVTVDDNAMFRSHGIVPNEILGTLHFVANDADSNPNNNVVDLSRNMASLINPIQPGDYSHGNGTMTFQGVTVYMSGGGHQNHVGTPGALNVLPEEAGFVLQLNDGVVFNASRQNVVFGAVNFHNVNPANPVKIDGEEAIPATPNPTPPYYSFNLTKSTWYIFGTGLTAWSGKTEKVGAGKVTIDRDAGAPVTVNAGSFLQISGGTFEAGGTADPFTDNTLTPGLSMDIVNNSTATGLLISQGVKNVGDISGSGNTTVSGPTGTELIVDSIVQNNLTLGAGCTLTIRPIPGGPFASCTGITPVPEPATWILLVLATAGMMGWRARRRLYKSGS